MSKPRHDELYLADIVEAAKRVIAYTTGLSYAQFFKQSRLMLRLLLCVWSP